MKVVMVVTTYIIVLENQVYVVTVRIAKFDQGVVPF